MRVFFCILTENKCELKLPIDWIRAPVLCYLKWPLCQLFLNYDCLDHGIVVVMSSNLPEGYWRPMLALIATSTNEVADRLDLVWTHQSVTIFIWIFCNETLPLSILQSIPASMPPSSLSLKSSRAWKIFAQFFLHTQHSFLYSKVIVSKIDTHWKYKLQKFAKALTRRNDDTWNLRLWSICLIK